MAEGPSPSRVTAGEARQYQLRVDLADDAAEAARLGGDHAGLGRLRHVLDDHGAALRCLYDAFAGYCAEAEERGIEHYPLYAWTKAVIADPAKKAKYAKSFAIHVGSGEVYARDRADALEAALRPFVGGEVVTRLAKHDTDPANNPQMPEKYRPRS